MLFFKLVSNFYLRFCKCKSKSSCEYLIGDHCNSNNLSLMKMAHFDIKNNLNLTSNNLGPAFKLEIFDYEYKFWNWHVWINNVCFWTLVHNGMDRVSLMAEHGWESYDVSYCFDLCRLSCTNHNDTFFGRIHFHPDMWLIIRSPSPKFLSTLLTLKKYWTVNSDLKAHYWKY